MTAQLESLSTPPPVATPPAQGVVRSSSRKNFYWTLVANVISAGCQWGIMSLIAKIGSPSMLGEYALALAITAPIVILASAPKFIQITAHESEFTFGEYTMARLWALGAGVVAVVVIALASHYDRTTLTVLALVMLAKVFDSLSDGVYGLLQQREVMERIAQSRIIQGGLQLLVLAITLRLTGSMVWAALSLAVTSAAVTFTFDAHSAGAMLAGVPVRAAGAGLCRKVLADAVRVWQRGACWRLCVLAAPVGIVVVVMTLNSSLLRYLVEHHLGPAELGLFSAMSYLGFTGATVVNAMGQALTPALARRLRSPAHPWASFWSLLGRLVGLCLALGIGFVVVAYFWGRPLMTILYTREYANNQSALLLLAVASAVSYVASALGYGLTAARYLKIQLPLHLLVLGTTFAFGVRLIPTRGIDGAAWALVASGLVQAVASAGIFVWAALRQRRGPVEESTGAQDAVRAG